MLAVETIGMATCNDIVIKKKKDQKDQTQYTRAGRKTKQKASFTNIN